MKFLPFLLLPFLPISAEAITWNQFWKPFRYERPYYYYQVPMCDRRVYREEYVQGNYWTPGYVRRWTEVERVPCGY